MYEDDGHFTCIPFVPPKDRTPLTKEQIKHAEESFQEVLNAPPGYTNATEEEKRAHPEMFKD
ncbi:hypothetical protein SDC9_183172 [bioreactor metagenome]|uniref:Uncharacterized protein n=1 Tax=bioreactor metagenome TaxID=1076179 RepID=A0A645HHT6_9ZZZZ